MLHNCEDKILDPRIHILTQTFPPKVCKLSSKAKQTDRFQSLLTSIGLRFKKTPCLRGTEKVMGHTHVLF